jgi:hypothetical protein
LQSETIAGAFVEATGQLRKGKLAYLALFDDALVLFQARRFLRPKPKQDVIASAKRTAIRSAEIEKGRLAGVLDVAFEDGSSWHFDVPAAHLDGAQQIVASLAADRVA